ncbi:MAG: response regulator transcription factor [Clostridia bacterium]|nr:response regulator transcription factor [Clostridia bacterium]
MIKVLLADDQFILADGLKRVIETDSGLTVCGIAKNGEEAVTLARMMEPDVVLMDIRMPEMNGVVATKKIKEINENIKVIVLTTFDDTDYIMGAINNGATGYLLKDIGADALISSIKAAYSGDTILPSKIAKKITDAAMMVSDEKEIKLKKMFGLSDREVEVALMLYDGFTNRQIASAIKISDGTVRNYISSIYLKLGVEGRADAMKIMGELVKKP